MTYEGKVYQAPSGQWSWTISDDDGDVVSGAGYPTKAEALEAMNDHLVHYNSRNAIPPEP